MQLLGDLLHGADTLCVSCSEVCQVSRFPAKPHSTMLEMMAECLGQGAGTSPAAAAKSQIKAALLKLSLKMKGVSEMCEDRFRVDLRWLNKQTSAPGYHYILKQGAAHQRVPTALLCNFRNFQP